jgi:sugar phosphate isomerase/epimerase
MIHYGIAKEDYLHSMEASMDRRSFLGLSAGVVGGLCMKGCALPEFGGPSEPFKISLAEWSLHKRLFGRETPELDNLDFARTASEYGIEGLEYVNQFFMDKATDKSYLAEMKKRADDFVVKSLLIMCDREGSIGDPDTAKRKQTVDNHHKWVEAAKFLGCHSIRVNAYSEGTPEEQRKLVVDGLHSLSEYAGKSGLNVLVENHGGLSSNPRWLTSVIEQVNLGNCGTLPDFGNFPAEEDRYEAVKMMMPYAKSVSAKSNEFDAQGNEVQTDYRRMMKIVLDAGYHGYVGIEYGGSKLSEPAGILATKRLLEEIKAEHMTT